MPISSKIIPLSVTAEFQYGLTPQLPLPPPLPPQILQVLLLLVLVTEHSNSSNSSTSSASLIPWISLMPPSPRHFLSVSLEPDSHNGQSTTPPWNLWRQFNLRVLVLHLNRVIEPLSFEYKPSSPSYFCSLPYRLYLQGFSFFYFSSPSSLLPLIYLEIIFFYFLIFINSSWLTPTACTYSPTCFMHPPLPSATALSSPFSVVFICITIFSLLLCLYTSSLMLQSLPAGLYPSVPILTKTITAFKTASDPLWKKHSLQANMFRCS